MILASHATAQSSTYDPSSRSVTLGSAATPYQLAHERAHEAQHRECTRAWQFHERTKNVPYLCRFARLWLECEAAKLALGALEYAGLLDRHAKSEARSGRWSYLRALIW